MRKFLESLPEGGRVLLWFFLVAFLGGAAKGLLHRKPQTRWLDVFAQALASGFTGFIVGTALLRWSPEEAALVERISNRLAEVAIRLPGALPEDQARLLLKRDAALASLANVGVAQAVKSERLMRQSVLNVVTKLLQIGVGILAAQ